MAGAPTEHAPGTAYGAGGPSTTSVGHAGNPWGHPSTALHRDWRINRDHRTTAVDADPAHYGSGWTDKTKNQERRR